MKKYLFIVLLVGFCFGQTVPDTLMLKSGKTFLGKYLSKDETFTHFKNQKSTKKDRIRNSVIEEVRLGNGLMAKKVVFIGEVHKVSNHLIKAGQHLENNVKYTIYGSLLSPIGSALIMEDIKRGELPLIGMAVFGYAVHLSYEGFASIARSGKELKKASKPMKEIERKIKKTTL